MLQPAPRKKHGTGRWIRRGILLLVVIYAAMALVPCAVPPQQTAAQKADTSWVEAEASDLNADRACCAHGRGSAGCPACADSKRADLH